MSIAKIESEDLRTISSFDDALRLLAEKGVQVLDATTEIGDGFRLQENKDRLIDVPLVLISWTFTQGDYGSDFVTVRAVTESGDKIIFNDGGLGVNQQLREFTDRRGVTAGLMVQGGLRKSEYTYVDESDGKEKPATTYYLGV